MKKNSAQGWHSLVINCARLVAILIAILALPARAGTLTITNGSLPKGLVGTFTVEFTWTIPNTDAAQMPAFTDTQTEFDTLFDVYFQQDSAAIGFNAQTQSTANTKLYLQNAVLKSTTSTTDGNSKVYDWTVDVHEATPGALSGLATGGSLTIEIYGYPNVQKSGRSKGTTNDGDSGPKQLTQQSYEIIDAPSIANVVESMNSLSVGWDINNAVNVAGGTSGPTHAPDGVRIYVIDPLQFTGTIKLPSKVSTPSATTADTVGAGCTFSPPHDNSTYKCIDCGTPASGTYNYIDYATLDGNIGNYPGVVSKSGINSAGANTIGNLVNGTKYVIFAQYEPTGAGITQCRIATPKPNYTLTEINGEGPPTVVDFRCFIATAAYGSPLGPELKFFRKFRDHVLLHHYLGQRFVHYYYKFSPPLADFIAAHEPLRTATRWLLEGPAKLLKTMDEYY